MVGCISGVGHWENGGGGGGRGRGTILVFLNSMTACRGKAEPDFERVVSVKNGGEALSVHPLANKTDSLRGFFSLFSFSRRVHLHEPLESSQGSDHDDSSGQAVPQS